MAPVLLAAMSPRLRERWTSSARKRSTWLVAPALAFPCGVFAIEYFVHVLAQVNRLQEYLPEFHWGGTPNETAVSFVVRNSRNFFNLFSPVEFQGTTALAVVIVLLGAAAWWAIVRKSRTPAGEETQAATIVFAIVIVLAISYIPMTVRGAGSGVKELSLFFFSPGDRPSVQCCPQRLLSG